MQSVIILGAGAHAAEIERYINDNNQYHRETVVHIVGFLDDNAENHSRYKLKSPLLGGLFGYEVPEGVQLIIGVSGITLRKRIIQEYKIEKKCQFYTFIHHSCTIFDTVKIGEGNIICPSVQLGPLVEIGNFNSLNNRVNIGHDSIIGDNNVFCPNVGLSGNTQVGNDNFFSLNVATIPSVKIGNGNTIAPNMVVEKSIKDDSYFFHRFKEVVLAVPK